MKSASRVVPKYAGTPSDYSDPEAKVPRLPMPYRMIDKVLRDLIEEALELVRDDPPREEPLQPVSPSFSLDIPDIAAVQPAKDGLIIFVATKAGKILCVNSLRGETVGEPIDLEESIKCMTLAADGRLLAVAIGGAGDEEEAEPMPSTVKLMLVQADKPFLKTVTSTKLTAEAVALYFSFDSCVFAAQLKTNQLECFRTAITVPFLEQPDVEPTSPVNRESSMQPDGVDAPEELAPVILVTDPVCVLLTPAPLVLSPDEARMVVMLCKSPKVRQVGELENKHCVHVNLVMLGSHAVEKYRLREGALPPPPEGEEPSKPESHAEVMLRLPHAVSALALDASTALLFTGLANGGCVLWNNVFGTQLFALKRHKTPVTAAAFTLYEQEGDTPLLITAAQDGVLNVHDTKLGTLKATFQKVTQLPKVIRILPTTVPLVLLLGEARGGEGKEGGEEGSAAVQVFSLEDYSTKAFFKLPAPYVHGAVRTRLSLPSAGVELGELTPVISHELPPPKPPPAEGEEEEEEEEGGEEVAEGEEDPKKGKCKLMAFRLIDMLALAFPKMVKTQYGSWIQVGGYMRVVGYVGSWICR